MKIKGTVLEIYSDTALVMTSECDFMEINRLEGLETGQEVVFSRRDVVRKSKRNGRVTFALVACLALFFICIPVYISFFTGTAGAAVAYVSLDINPSLELAVNDRSKVLDAAAFNQDGEKLLQSVSVLGKPVTEAITALIKSAEKMQYLSNDVEDLVLVCLTPAGTGNTNPELLVNIGDKLADFEKSNTARIKVVGATNIQHQEAKRMGMSAGRYALWKDTAKSDQGKFEQYKNGKLADFVVEPKGSGNVNGNGPGNGKGKANGIDTPQNLRPVKETGQNTGRVIPPVWEDNDAPGLKEFQRPNVEPENELNKDKPVLQDNTRVNNVGNATGIQKNENHKKRGLKEKGADLLEKIKRKIKAGK